MAKRFGAETVENIEMREIPFLEDAVIETYLDDPQRFLLAALVNGLNCRSFFEIGTNRGRTAWTVAHNNPDVQVYTLDVTPGTSAEDTALEFDADDYYYFRRDTCGEAFRDTPEAARITQLWGDSATFDFSAYEGSIDFVYVDGAHTYEYVTSDTSNALRMLSPDGTIAWDDYTNGPGVYQHVVDLAPTLDLPVFHIFGTRMAFHSRQDFVQRRPPSHTASLATV